MWVPTLAVLSFNKFAAFMLVAMSLGALKVSKHGVSGGGVAVRGCVFIIPT